MNNDQLLQLLNNVNEVFNPLNPTEVYMDDLGYGDGVKVVVVSEQFDGLSFADRRQLIRDTLIENDAELLKFPIKFEGVTEEEYENNY